MRLVLAAVLSAAPVHSLVATGPVWSPDGASIAYTQQRADEPPQLIVAAPDGSRRRAILANAYAPKWSPDGSLIAYLSSDPASANVDQLWVVEPNTIFGGGPFRVADGVANFAWSADGQELLYDHGWNTCSSIDAVSTFDFTKRRTVVTGASPVPSPDGKLLAFFTSSPPGACAGGFGNLSIANVDGTNVHVVLTGPAEAVAWSPDGTQLAVQVEGNEGPVVELVRADGTDARLAALGSRPAWSPDGRRLAFLSRALVSAPFPRDEPSLQILDLASQTTSRRLLSASAELHGGPVWSPDGDSVALARALERGGVSEGIAAGLNRFVSVYAVPVAAPAHATRVSAAPCELLVPRCTQAGGPGGNVLDGTPGRDVIWGYGGDDRFFGGAGDDELHGGSGNDTIVGGNGRDMLAGGSGGDVILTRDGVRDSVYCGSGYDTVIADRLDAVAPDCEHVVRG